jgi:hypothetical protein
MGQNGDRQLEDLAHERAVWKVEHWGWAAFALVLLASLIGLFGDGPLARATAGRPNSMLWVEYDRFVRCHAPATLKVHLRPSGNNSLPALWVARNFLERVEVEHISPEPERIKAAGESLIYIFDVMRTNEKTLVTFQLKPTDCGNASVSLGLVDGPQLQFTQFIYP